LIAVTWTHWFGCWPPIDSAQRVIISHKNLWRKSLNRTYFQTEYSWYCGIMDRTWYKCCMVRTLNVEQPTGSTLRDVVLLSSIRTRSEEICRRQHCPRYERPDTFHYWGYECYTHRHHKPGAVRRARAPGTHWNYLVIQCCPKATLQEVLQILVDRSNA